MQLTKVDCHKLSLKILNDFFKPINTYKTTIFLCGAELNQTSKIRFKLSQALANDWLNSLNYDLVFPEDIFEELLFSSKSDDLLTLEGLLADSVDAIIIIPESPGSFAELGAFSNNAKLRNKIVCLVDQQYKKDKSFINQGPIKLIKNTNKHGIIYIDPKMIDGSMSELSSSLRKIKKTSSKVKDKINLLQLDNFLLPTIYLLEPVSKQVLIDITNEALEHSVNINTQVTTTVINMMVKKKLIELGHDGYKLTKLGANQFLNLTQTRSRFKNQHNAIALDEVRLEVLNLRLRNKNLKM